MKAKVDQLVIFLLSYKSVFKKEGKNSREVRGGEDLSTGLAQDVLNSALCTGRS
jgi:hypothetical protein